MVTVINREEGWVGHRLTQLGIRVWPDRCQLVAKSGEQWMTLGPPRKLPLKVPGNPAELVSAANDPLLITAYQYMGEYPGADLALLLARKKDFALAMNPPAA